MELLVVLLVALFLKIAFKVLILKVGLYGYNIYFDFLPVTVLVSKIIIEIFLIKLRRFKRPSFY